MKKVVYQGYPGAFSEEAALKYYKDDISLFGVRTFREMFYCVVSKKADIAVVPVENSIAGSVAENYDFLYQNNVLIVGEEYVRVRHQLMVLGENTKLSDVEKAFSHYKALEQCQKFFTTHKKIEPAEYFDTAGAAEFVSKEKKENIAAIASDRAANIYGLKIIKKNIEDNKNNWTRFLLVRRGKGSYGKVEPNKVSIAFILPHKHGSLYDCLEIFSKTKINMSKIESRPMPDKAFEYIFYIDLVFDPKRIDVVKGAISDLRKKAKKIKVLGFYRRASL